MLNTKLKVLLLILFSWLITGCAGTKMDTIATVKQVDLSRFMGDWYVIAVIPTPIETQAYNAIEKYKLEADGTIATTFTYYKGAFDGPLKTYKPRGFVVKDTGNALWGMQFIWPIKAEYRIAYLDQNYQHTVIARNARDYVWIMARTPQIDDAKYVELTQFVKNLGYDTAKLRKVPQSWTGLAGRPEKSK
ncbi:MAG: lipocalin family protein [Pseudomonadota bacterium]